MPSSDLRLKTAVVSSVKVCHDEKKVWIVSLTKPFNQDGFMKDSSAYAGFVEPQGCGVGLRTRHYEEILRDWPAMDWFEAISENYMDSGGRPVKTLEAVRNRYPVALHGVSLSIGSIDPLNPIYLERLKKLAQRIDPFVVSDHLCWTGVEGSQLHDLLPLPFTEEALSHIVSRVQQVQETLGRSILLENVSSYVTYKHSVIPEWEFLAEAARRSGCGILLDLNNVYVNANNHGFDPYDFLRGVPASRVGQFHLAGHTDMGGYLFDTHSGEVIDPVWKLYQKALELYGPVSTLIEWDEAIPEFSRLSAEAAKARAYYLTASNPAQKETLRSDSKARSLSGISAPTLGDIQKKMKNYFQIAGSGSAHEGSDFLNPQGKTPGAERMSIYAEGYPIRIHEALKEAYEAVRHVLGSQKFREISDVYAARHPSREYNLSMAGRFYPEYLEKSGLLAQWPFLQDLARLEWAVTEAFHSFDLPPEDLSSLNTLALEEWESVTFLFQPSLRLVSSVWPVVDIWRERKDADQGVRAELHGRPQCASVCRQDLKVRVEAIHPLEFECLKLLSEGQMLGEVCEKLAEKNSEELPLMEWFSKWSSSGMIARVLTSAARESQQD